MSAELETLPDEIDAATKHQMDLALMKARDIQGTYLNDLESALNMIRQYRRALQLVQAPDPNGTDATDLLKKYNMYGAVGAGRKSESEKDRQERQAKELAAALGTLSSARKQRELAPPPKRIGTKSEVLPEEPEEEEVLDAEVVE